MWRWSDGAQYERDSPSPRAPWNTVVRPRRRLRDYGELTALIREYEAGWIVSPEDPEGVAQTLREILASPRRHVGAANAQHLARER
jgi:hypothetical protein